MSPVWAAFFVPGLKKKYADTDTFICRTTSNLCKKCDTKVAGSILEWTTLLAMLVYWIVALGIIKLFLMGKTVSTPEAAAKLDK